MDEFKGAPRARRDGKYLMRELPLVERSRGRTFYDLLRLLHLYPVIRGVVIKEKKRKKGKETYLTRPYTQVTSDGEVKIL